MKESKNAEIKIRINSDLKQEFLDVFGDMSKKLTNLIEDSLEAEKEKYLKELISICTQKDEGLKTFEKVLDYIINTFCTGEGPSLSDSYESLKVINKGSEDIFKLYGKDGKEIFLIIYRDLINGLFKGSEDDTLNQRLTRLYRNMSNIINYIIKRIYK